MFNLKTYISIYRSPTRVMEKSQKSKSSASTGAQRGSNKKFGLVSESQCLIDTRLLERQTQKKYCFCFD